MLPDVKDVDWRVKPAAKTRPDHWSTAMFVNRSDSVRGRLRTESDTSWLGEGRGRTRGAPWSTVRANHMTLSNYRKAFLGRKAFRRFVVIIARLKAGNL